MIYGDLCKQLTPLFRYLGNVYTKSLDADEAESTCYYWLPTIVERYRPESGNAVSFISCVIARKLIEIRRHSLRECRDPSKVQGITEQDITVEHRFEIDGEDSVNNVWRQIAPHLTDLQRKVLSDVSDGYTYKETAKRQRITPKQVDNAMVATRQIIRERVPELGDYGNHDKRDSTAVRSERTRDSELDQRPTKKRNTRKQGS